MYIVYIEYMCVICSLFLILILILKKKFYIKNIAITILNY